VKLSVQFTRLYVGGIPKSKTKEDVFNAFSKEVDKLKDVIMQDANSEQTDVKNKGFCFLEFESYFDAAAARKKLLNGRQRISAWDNFSRFVVDWAIPLENPDEEVAANSTVILVNNLNDSITNDDLVARFQKYGTIKKVNKKAHYAFITFHERPAALTAEQTENKATLKDCQMDVQMHTPLSGIAKRMVQTIKGPNGAANGGPPRSAGVQMMRQGGMMPANRGRGRGGAVPFAGNQGGQYPRSAGVPRRAGQFTKSRILQRNAGQNQAMYGPTGGYVEVYEGNQQGGGAAYGGMGPSGYGGNQNFSRF
jgi:RNA recognition motif-containing protein